jgi:GTP-binding protein Era
MYYPEDMVIDHPERFVVAEMIREKIIQLTQDEIPHSVAIEIEEMVPRSDDMVFVRAIIFVERDSQKGIVIGAGGQLLRQIGQQAREDIEGLLGSRVYLDLWVRVKKDWRSKDGSLKELGYD